MSMSKRLNEARKAFARGDARASASERIAEAAEEHGGASSLSERNRKALVFKHFSDRAHGVFSLKIVLSDKLLGRKDD